MKRLTTKRIETARQIVRDNAKQYEDKFGVGPCGALGLLLQAAGWGKLAMVETAPRHKVASEYAWYPHYVVVRDGKIIDISGEYTQEVTPAVEYRSMEFMTDTADPLWGADDLDFWRAALAGVL